VLALGREETVLEALLDSGDPQAILPAAGVAWSMGFAPELIRSGLAAMQAQPAVQRTATTPALAEEPTF
jgi:hypothetical protein